jgi:hypothetical protein
MARSIFNSPQDSTQESVPQDQAYSETPTVEKRLAALEDWAQHFEAAVRSKVHAIPEVGQPLPHQLQDFYERSQEEQRYEAFKESENARFARRLAQENTGQVAGPSPK